MIYTEKTREAAVLAHKAHIAQVDKSGFPYFLHLLLVADQAQTEDECVVALLHDICEDVSMDYLEVIREKFGDTIADAVDAITRRKGQETHFEYIDRCKMTPLAAQVKLYDLHHNMTPQRTQMLPPDQQGLTKRFEKSRRIVTEALRQHANADPEAGADGEEPDEKGRTPLMLAMQSDLAFPLTTLLIKHGADPTIRDANGFTAQNYAQFDNASPEVLKLLTTKE